MIKIFLKFKKIIYAFLFLFTLSLSHLYTYKIANYNAEIRAFIVEISMHTLLLKALDENKTDTVKNILTYSSLGLFYDAGKRNNIEIFLPLCKEIDKDTMLLLEKYILFEDNEIDRLEKLGKEKIEKLCNIE